MTRKIVRLVAPGFFLGAALLAGCNNETPTETASGPKVLEHTEIKLPPGALEKEMAQQRERSQKTMSVKK